MKKGFVFIATFLAASVSLATDAKEESRDFKGVLQCRTIEDSSLRLSCYDNSIPVSYTHLLPSAEKTGTSAEKAALTGVNTCHTPVKKPEKKALIGSQ